MRENWIGLSLALMAMSAAAQNTFPASGNVGIGTPTPDSALAIGPPTNTTTKYQLAFLQYDETDSYPQIVIDTPYLYYVSLGTDTRGNLVLGTTTSPNEDWVSEQLVIA